MVIGSRGREEMESAIENLAPRVRDGISALNHCISYNWKLCFFIPLLSIYDNISMFLSSIIDKTIGELLFSLDLRRSR